MMPMAMASVGSLASMPQRLTHINTDGLFIKVWGIVEQDKADLIRDMIEVYSPKLRDGVGQLRSLSELIPGKIVLALYNDQFQRAEIIKQDSTQSRNVIVKLIDSGITASVDVAEIRLADNMLASAPRTGFAEEFVLGGVIAKNRKPWTNQEVDSVNLCLRHCTELTLTGIVGDKKILQIVMSMNPSTRIRLSAFLVEGGLAESVNDELLTNALRAKYGKTSVSSMNQYSVPPPSIPNVPTPANFATPQQSLIRGPSSTTIYANDAPQPSLHSYQRIRVPKPLQSVQQTVVPQNYVYQTLPVDSLNDVVVSHVIDGMNAFTVQLKKSTDIDLPKLMARINDIRPIPITEQIGPGALCLGRFMHDNSVCRAVVSNVLNEGASLYFVDFGNTEVVPFNEIYKIPPEFLLEPAMAIRFALADLSGCYTLTTSEAQKIFSSLALHGDYDFKLKVLKPLVPTQQRCELFIVMNGKAVNIKNKILDKCKLMRPVEYKKTTFKKNQIADVVVTYAESPSRFFIQLEINTSILEMLMKCVADYCTNSENKDKDILFTEDIVENMAVCALYEDNTYYRGLVVDEPDDEGNVTVFYVDYGNTEPVHYSKLRIMNNEMMSQFPTQACECRLDIDQSLVKNEEVAALFIELADGESFKMTVKNVLPGHILLVDLVDQNNVNLANHIKETFAPSSYASPPKAQSSSGNWREKATNANTEGDFSSFRDERRSDPRDDRSRLDSNPNFRNHDDRTARGRNYEPRRRDSGGIDTTDEASGKKPNEFWARDKGSRPDSGEPWRHDKFNSDQSAPRDRNDNHGTFRKREDDNNTWNSRNNNEDARGGGRPPRREGFNDRPPRRDDRSNEAGSGSNNSWEKTSNNWDDKASENRGNTTNNAWHNKEQTNEAWGSTANNQNNDRGNRRNFDNDRGGGFGDDRERREGGFRKKDDNFNSNSYSRGSKTYDEGFSGRNTVTLLDGFEKGAKIADAEYNPGQQFDAVISWFVSPVNFYLIPNDNADFRQLMEQIQSDYPTRKTINTNDISSDDHVVARDKENVIYRATVLRPSPRGAIVTFVDYGNTETVGKSQVWAINPEHCVIPKQAVQCCLHNVKSSDENGVWTAAADYDTYFGKDGFKATIVENVEQDGSKVWAVNLTDPEGLDVADQLVANKLAVRKVVLTSEELFDTDLFVNQIIAVFTAAIESPKKFFVHIEPDKADHIGSYIQGLTETSPLPIENVIVGEMCLAPSSDDELYRALIMSVNEEEKQAHVKFIDYGDEFDVSFDGLKVLPDYLKQYNAQAVQCCLYDCESLTDVDAFNQEIEEKDLLIKVMEVKDNVLYVKLFNTEGAALPYPVESKDIVPVVCQAPVLRPIEKVVISSVTSNKVYLQRPTDQHAVNELNNKLHEKYDNDASQEKVQVELGKFYVAKSGQFEAWYRCQLLEAEPDKIFYIDYGNTEPIEGLLAIRPLDAEFYITPMCCFGVTTDADISTESAETFMASVQDIVFDAIIKNTSTNATPGVELYADLRTADGKKLADLVVESNCGSKRSSEPEPSYNAFENWNPNESKNVRVSAVTSPVQFCLILKEDSDKLTKMQDDLENMLRMALPLVGNTDKLCAVKSAVDGKWYRCYQADNLAVDYGLVIEPCEYKVLPVKYAFNNDKYCAECRLDVDSLSNDWSQPTIDKFKGLVEPQIDLEAKLEATRDGKLIVDLVSNGSSVTDTLLNEGLVKYQEYEVLVSHATSLTEFYVQDKATQDDLFDLLEKLKEGEQTWDQITPEVGQIVAAKFPEDDDWYRAKVISVVEDTIQVLFIDYGNQSPCTEFRALPEDLSQVPKYASLCQAHPLPENAEELREKFVTFVEDHAEDSFKVYYLNRHVEPQLVMLYFGEEVIEHHLVEREQPENGVVDPEPERQTLEFKNVTVVHINSPSSFYVQIETPLLDEVADRLDEVEANESPVTDGMTVGSLYAAKFLDDGVWYRAKAIGTNEVLFIDFGNTAVVEEVRNLPADLKVLPILAKHCAFKPPPGLNEWPEGATERFRELSCDGDTVFTMNIIEEGDPAGVQMVDNGASVLEELYTLCKAELTAPSNENDKPGVIISYINGLNELWIQEQVPALEELVEELSKIETFDPLEASAVEVGDIVAALFDEDGVLYRAKVLEKLEEGCNVLFIDYGNESQVKEIKSLPEDLARMPAFAFKSSLCGIPDDAAANWPSSILEKLEEISENVENFVLLNKEVKDQVTYVSLQYDGDTELNKQLIELYEQSNSEKDEPIETEAQEEVVKDVVAELGSQPQEDVHDLVEADQHSVVDESQDIVGESETQDSIQESDHDQQPEPVDDSQSQSEVQDSTEKTEPIEASSQDEAPKSEIVESSSITQVVEQELDTSAKSKVESVDQNEEPCVVESNNIVDAENSSEIEVVSPPPSLSSIAKAVVEKVSPSVDAARPPVIEESPEDNFILPVPSLASIAKKEIPNYDDTILNNFNKSNDDSVVENIVERDPSESTPSDDRAVDEPVVVDTTCEVEVAKPESIDTDEDFCDAESLPSPLPGPKVVESFFEAETQLAGCTEPQEGKIDEIVEAEIATESGDGNDDAENSSFEPSEMSKVEASQSKPHVSEDIREDTVNEVATESDTSFESALTNIIDEVIEKSKNKIASEPGTCTRTIMAFGTIDEPVLEESFDEAEAQQSESNAHSCAEIDEAVVAEIITESEDIPGDVSIVPSESTDEKISEDENSQIELRVNDDTREEGAINTNATESTNINVQDDVEDETSTNETASELKSFTIELTPLSKDTRNENENHTVADDDLDGIISSKTKDTSESLELKPLDDSETVSMDYYARDEQYTAELEEPGKYEEDENVDEIGSDESAATIVSGIEPASQTAEVFDKCVVLEEAIEEASEVIEPAIESNQADVVLPRETEEVVQSFSEFEEKESESKSEIVSTEIEVVAESPKVTTEIDHTKEKETEIIKKKKSVEVEIVNQTEVADSDCNSVRSMTNGLEKPLYVSPETCSTIVDENESLSIDSPEKIDADPKAPENSPSYSPEVSPPRTLSPAADEPHPVLETKTRQLIEGSEYSVMCVLNPGNFYVQNVSDRPLIKSMEERLKKAEETRPMVKEAKIGSMYGAKMANSWFRVKVLDSDPYHGYDVFCIDYGNEICAKQLFNLPEELKIVPPFAVRCGLPLPAHLNVWPAKVTFHFETITLVNSPVFKLQRVLASVEEDAQMVNLTNGDCDVWKEIKEMCLRCEDEDEDANLSDDDQYLSPTTSPLK